MVGGREDCWRGKDIRSSWTCDASALTSAILAIDVQSCGGKGRRDNNAAQQIGCDRCKMIECACMDRLWCRLFGATSCKSAHHKQRSQIKSQSIVFSQTSREEESVSLYQEFTKSDMRIINIKKWLRYVRPL